MDTIDIVFIIFIAALLIIIAVATYREYEKQKQKEQERRSADLKWSKIHIGLSKSEIYNMLGNPHSAAVVSEQCEIWEYGTDEQHGEIQFENDKVVAYKKP